MAILVGLGTSLGTLPVTYLFVTDEYRIIGVTASVLAGIITAIAYEIARR